MRLPISDCYKLSSYRVPLPRYSVRQVHNRYIRLQLLCLTSPTEGFPSDDLRKIFMKRSQMTKVPNGIETLPENLNRPSRVHERYRQTTYRRQPDGGAISSRSLKTRLSKSVTVTSSNIMRVLLKIYTCFLAVKEF